MSETIDTASSAHDKLLKTRKATFIPHTLNYAAIRSVTEVSTEEQANIYFNFWLYSSVIKQVSQCQPKGETSKHNWNYVAIKEMISTVQELPYMQ